MAGNRKPYDRQILPLVGQDHALGPLRRVGRFEWEKVIMRSTFQPSSIKLVALSAATYADTVTGANVRPGIARLIAVTGLGDSMVRRNLKALEGAGFMFMVASGSNYGRGGKGAASEYQLTTPEILAEQYEAERNAETWDETDQWDMKMIADHRYPSTGDSAKFTQKNTGTFGVSPVLHAGTPVLGAQNTGTPVPPTSPIPLHELPLHQSNPHPASSVTLGDAHASEPMDNSGNGTYTGPGMENERRRQMDELQKLIEKEKGSAA